MKINYKVFDISTETVESVLIESEVNDIKEFIEDWENETNYFITINSILK